MSLVVLAIGLEVYQVTAHVHCFSGRTLPASHRSTGGFGAAILGDALSYALSCVCLFSAGATWQWLLVPLLAHVFYGGLLAFVRPLYMRIHDYRLSSIYADGAFCRLKRVASFVDTGFHVLAVLLLAPQATVFAASPFAVLGVAVYLVVFAPRVQDAIWGKLRPAPAVSRLVRDQRL